LERTHRQKRKQIDIKKRDKLVDRKKFSSIYRKKLLIYRAVMKPIRSYGIELWGCARKFSIVIMHRSQSKTRAIANAPWFVTNHTVHTDFNIPYVIDVFSERINKHHNNVEAHPNPLLEPLLQPVNTRGLERY
jgi:hypothetical protein